MGTSLKGKDCGNLEVPTLREMKTRMKTSVNLNISSIRKKFEKKNYFSFNHFFKTKLNPKIKHKQERWEKYKCKGSEKERSYKINKFITKKEVGAEQMKYISD